MKNKYKIGVCGINRGRAIAQAKMIAFEIKSLGIKNVEILPFEFREKSSGIKPDTIIMSV